MGRAYITYIYDDGIRHAAESPEAWENVAEELGTATLELCLDPKKHFDASEGLVRTTHHKIASLENCLNLVADVHSSDEEVYLWGNNCLRSITCLSREELVATARLINWELKRRPK